VRWEVEDSPDQSNAKIVVFYLKEKPVVRRIEYRGTNSLTESDILEALRDKKVGLSTASPSGIGGPTRLRPTPFAIGLGLTLGSAAK
jgi:hypothetical protein